MKSSSLLLGLATGVGVGFALGYWYWRRTHSSSSSYGITPLVPPMKNKEEWNWERDEHGDICRVIINRSVSPQ